MSDYIPLSIQEEIMKRLPTKSLMQFRTVSKAWKSLIDSSKFVVDYSVNHTHQQHILVSQRSLENFETKHVSIVDDDTFPHNKFSLTTPVPELSMLKLLGSSHGLFCLFSKGVDLNEPIRNKPTAVLWNPSIRKSVAIDVLGSATNYTVTGFGVCPHTIDPKLVKIQYNYALSVDIAFSPWQVEVYNLSSRAWRSIPTANKLRNTTEFMEKQVDLDGTIYWLAVDGSTRMMPPTFFLGYNLIISFDLTSEEFVEVSLPDTLSRSYYSLAISKLKQSLVVVDAVNDANKLVYGVWMMEHGVPNSFTKLYSINSPDASIGAVLGFRRNNEPIFSTRSDTDDVDVHEFHSEDLSYARIYGNPYFVSAYSYMETLLLQDQ